MPPEPDDRNLQITSRISRDLRRQLDAINARYNTSDAKNLVALLEAFAAVVEAEDAVRFPVEILMAEKQQALVAETKPLSAGQPEVDKPPKKPDKTQRHRGDGPHRKIS